MTRKFGIFGLLVLWHVSVAHAQVTANSEDQNAPSAPTSLTIASFDPENAIAPISVVEGPGVKIGEGTVLHPVFGIETGLVSNVFYESNDPSAAGVLRLIGQIGTASLNAARLNPNSGGTDYDEAETDKGDFEYQASIRLAYDQPLSTNSTVTDTGGLGVGALLRGMVNPMGTASFGFDEDFMRMIRAANFETSQNDNRDVNNLRLLLLLHPPGRTLSGYVYYQNMIDVIEDDDQYPDRIDHRIGIHPMWRWLPQTVVFGDASLGFVSGLGDMSSRKIGSMPLIAKLGISTLLSLKTSVSLAAGYTNGFYDSGPSFSAPVIDATVGYRYSPLGRIAVAYNLAYQDSINANFYRDHVIRVQIQQGFAPFVLMAQPELHFRSYEGVTLTGAPPTRDDIIFALVAGVHYNFRNWIAATLDYRFSTVQTDFRYMDNANNTIDPSFVRHELLLGMRIAL